MKEDKIKETNKMRETPVNKLMIQLGLPMILSMALQAVYNIVDSAFVGNMRTGSEAALNKRRATNYHFYTEKIWGMSQNYDLCLNSPQLGYERCIKLIQECI